MFDILTNILSFAFLAAVLRASTPLIFATIGGLLTELCGVINIALEGLMLTAAFFGVIAGSFYLHYFPEAPIWLAPWFGLVMGVFFSILVSAMLAFFHLELGSDLILAGIGINVFAGGLTVFLMYILTGDKGSTSNLASPTLPELTIPFVNKIPMLGKIFNTDTYQGHNIMIYIAFLSVILVWILLYKTALGKHLRAVGENEEAAKSVGIPIKKIKYISILLSGLFAGLGGVYLSMGYLSLFQANMTSGRGFTALAAIYLGNRHPIGAMIAALVFGASIALEPRLSLLNIPSDLVAMFPAVVTIMALILYSLHKSYKNKQNIKHIQKIEVK